MDAKGHAAEVLPGPAGGEVPEASAERKPSRGPKYRVAPGGSRPAKKASTAALAPAEEFLVVEFRTEPRVVPASRSSGQAKGKQVRHQFRPNSRQWAADRQALAAAAAR
mmetsp:Transcript_21640/g.68363  ORF Transcript_21640/g.68363 Transcript_21640/m.68363 type:complete len:109 (+) Transcript_21640:81-407(+)